MSLVTYLFCFEVLLQLAFFKLKAPLCDPVHEVPKRLEDDAIQNLWIYDFS